MILYLSPDEVKAVQKALILQLFNLEEGGAICTEEALQMSRDEAAIRAVMPRLGLDEFIERNEF